MKNKQSSPLFFPSPIKTFENLQNDCLDLNKNYIAFSKTFAKASENLSNPRKTKNKLKNSLKYDENDKNTYVFRKYENNDWYS